MHLRFAFFSGPFTGHDPTRGLGQSVSKLSRVESGRVRRFDRSSRAGSGGLTGRVGQGQEVSPVESGQEVIKYHGSRQVMSGRGRPGPRRVTLPMKCPDIVL